MKRIILAFLLISAFVSTGCRAGDVKDADLAGSWYPASKDALTRELEGYLAAAKPEKVNGHIFAVVSPHAGYQYSGPVAAYAFKALQDQDIKTVIILGFAHRKSFDGVAIYDRGSFRTPLGEIPIDVALASRIASQSGRIFFYAPAFQEENSIEMMVPFVQAALKDVKIVPMAFGTQSYEDAAIAGEVLASVLSNRPDCVIVASTDLSHYHPYMDANRLDKQTIQSFCVMKAKSFYSEAQTGVSELCGFMPVTATLLAAEKLGYDKAVVLKYANSGDTAGDKTNVVGYVSAAIYKEGSKDKPVVSEEKRDVWGDRPMLNDSQRSKLLQIARESITSYVRDGKRKRFDETDPVLKQTMGAFVTLRENGELRGCIGNMVGTGPLYQVVADMAIEAATGDPRFAQLSVQELGKIDIEISVLSPLKKVSSADEIKIPGHGVIVKRGFRSGVYLPQVATETGWNKEEFLTSLCAHKAGLPADAWKDPATDMFVFTAEIFGEKKEVR